MHPNEEKIIVLYDGDCGLCMRSVRYLKKLDWIKKLDYMNFQHEEIRGAIAPDLHYSQLDKAMHIKLPNGTFKNGFYAFRTMMWRLPLLFIFTPLMYIPGVPAIGNKAYAYVANRRKDCSHEACAL